MGTLTGKSSASMLAARDSSHWPCQWSLASLGGFSLDCVHGWDIPSQTFRPVTAQLLKDYTQQRAGPLITSGVHFSQTKTQLWSPDFAPCQWAFNCLCLCLSSTPSLSGVPTFVVVLAHSFPALWGSLGMIKTLTNKAHWIKTNWHSVFLTGQ